MEAINCNVMEKSILDTARVLVCISCTNLQILHFTVLPFIPPVAKSTSSVANMWFPKCFTTTIARRPNHVFINWFQFCSRYFFILFIYLFMYLSNYLFFNHAKNWKCDWRALGLSLLGYLLDWNIILIFEFVRLKKNSVVQ